MYGFVLELPLSLTRSLCIVGSAQPMFSFSLSLERVYSDGAVHKDAALFSPMEEVSSRPRPTPAMFRNIQWDFLSSSWNSARLRGHLASFLQASHSGGIVSAAVAAVGLSNVPLASRRRHCALFHFRLRLFI